MFKSKSELIQFVSHQVNIILPNDKDDRLNRKRKILYTQITDRQKYSVLPLLLKKGVRYEKHINNNYFIFIN